ncbi:short chain dehydrogenase reductase [Apiospora marii]|uniref:Short chain dehydrogenase reductase n=1 Tax=Apiospora marii TaxID=335849 RepID=A0ABR1RFK4_9PEZI
MPQPRLPVPTKINRDNGYPTISATRPENSASGKTVVVTGGGTGIGAETTRFFAAAGASRILLIGRRPEPLLATKASIESQYPATAVTATPTDVTDKAQVDAAFSNFAKDGSKIDVLISNAGMTGPLEGVGDVDPTTFMAGVQANVSSALYVAQAFLQHASDDAVVVNVSSNASYLNFANAFASYSVGKLAAYRVWDAVGFAHPRLRVYHLQPGIVDTDMNRAAGGVKALGYEDHVSLPAGFMLWLASPEAAFLKGKFLWSNWDVDELKARAEEIEKSDEFNIQAVGWSGKDAKGGSANSASDLWKK